MRDVDPDEPPGQLDLLLLAPIALTRLLLPGMVERGDGALLFASGTSALTPVPQLGNVGIALAGMRNYVHNLNGAFDGFDSDELRLAILEPDDIADVFWNLQHTRDRVEQVVGG